MGQVVGDVVTGVAHVLEQTLNGLGAGGKGLHEEADDGNLHNSSRYHQYYTQQKFKMCLLQGLGARHERSMR